MPAKRRSKYDGVREQLTVIFEDIKGHRATGDAAEAYTLADQARELITQLPDRGRREYREALAAALATPSEEPSREGGEEDSDESTPGTAVAVVAPTEDWQSAEGIQSLANAATQGFTSLVAGALEAGRASDRLTETMIQIRLRIINSDGVPDLRVRSQQTVAAHQAIYAAAGAAIKKAAAKGDYSQEEQEAELAKVIKGVQNRASRVISNYVKSLDSDRDEYELRFPRAVAEYPDLAPSEAVWTLYAKLGQPLATSARGSTDQVTDSDKKLISEAKRLRKAVTAIKASDVEEASPGARKMLMETITEVSQEIRVISNVALAPPSLPAPAPAKDGDDS